MVKPKNKIIPGRQEAGEARRNQNPIKIWATTEEKDQIKKLARYCGLSVSTYARKVSMGYRPKSHVDLEQMKTLFQLHADLGRVGGLLKWLLTDDIKLRRVEEKGLMPTVEDTIQDIYTLQDQIKKVVEKVIK